MSYTLKGDEMALIIRPIMDGDEWAGSIATGLTMGSDQLPHEIQSALLDIATLMSSFIDVAHENAELLDIVAERRDQLLQQVIAEDEGDYGDNVVKLSFNSKTMGSA